MKRRNRVNRTGKKIRKGSDERRGQETRGEKRGGEERRGEETRLRIGG